MRFTAVALVGLVLVATACTAPTGAADDPAPSSTAVPDEVPGTQLTFAPVEAQPLPCDHVPGSGDLAADLLGTWLFSYNASRSSVTLFPDGTVAGIAGTDILGRSPSWYESTWELEGNTLTIEVPGPGPLAFTFAEDAVNGWRLEGSGPSQWTRCGFVDARLAGKSS